MLIPSSSKGDGVAVTDKHYDIDVDFFARFLDPYMKYTSGLFSEHESLDVGVTRMLNLHSEFLKPFTDPRILEIGPGWGALPSRLRDLGVLRNYSAINPSQIQNRFLRSKFGSQIELIEAKFEDHDFSGATFDVVYFVGSFCHMPQKAEQLQRLCSLINPGGKIVIEDTFFLSEDLSKRHKNRIETKFVQDDIFGFAEILSLSTFLEMLPSHGFQVRTLLEHSSSYARSIDCWLAKLKSMTDHPATKPFIKYLEIAQRGWGYTIANYLIELQRVGECRIR
jgi:cyclopropane-fatty-acyl-phospholipid synthase